MEQSATPPHNSPQDAPHNSPQDAPHNSPQDTPTTDPNPPDTSSPSLPSRTPAVPGYEVVDFPELDGVPCPCGTARRGFADVADFPATLHITEISANAKLHYHKRLTETYYFLECGDDAQMQLNEEFVPVRPGMSIMIRPGTRHRAVGQMKVLIVVLPKFDPQDEWLD